MIELNRAQMQAWESSLEMASKALDSEGAGSARLRGRLRDTASALRESVETTRRLFEALTEARRLAADQKARLARVLAHAPIPYLLTTLDGLIIDMNPAASDALNLSARGLAGRNLLVFLADRESWRALLAQVAASGEPGNRPGRLRPRERLTKSIDAYVSLLTTADGPVIQWFIADGSPQVAAQIQDG